MLSYAISQSQPTDLDDACQLFTDAIEYQKKNGYPQYRCDDRDIQAEDIANGRHYKVVKNTELAAIFTMWTSDKKIWRHHDIGKSIYLHRIVTNQKYKGNALLQLIINWVNKYAIEHSKTSIRIDTWNNNPDLITYYEKIGFSVIEEFQIPNTDDMPINCRGNAVVLMEYNVK